MIDYKSVLNEEQYKAVTTIEGSLLIIAGAGTGKTRTIVYRAAYLIEHGVPTSSILMLTFTNKAAGEMKERTADLIGSETAKDITAGTFHSFCAKMLRKYYKQAGLDPGFAIITGNDDADIIDMQKAEEERGFYDKKGFPPSKKIADLISKSVNMGIPLEDMLEESRLCEFSNEIMTLKEKADKYKKDNSILNYDDLLLSMNRLLSTHPEVAQAISDSFAYIMVDEYQDTNTIQDMLLVLLRQNNHNLAVVGDDLQSLYGFRGAEVQYIIDYPKRMPGTKIVKLIRNYRSSQEILDLCNEISSHATEGYPKTLIGTHHSSIKPAVHYLSGQDQEAQCIVCDIIYDLHNRKGISLNEICILSRTSGMMAKTELLLNREGYDFVKYGGVKFFDREEVKTILSYFRVLSRSEDEIAWFKILQVHGGIGKTYAKRIAAECKTDGMEHLISSKYKRRLYAGELRKLYEILSSTQNLSVADVMNHVIDFYDDVKTRNIESMKVKDESNRTDAMNRHISIMNEIREALPPIAAGYKTITGFLDDLVLDNTAVSQNHSEEGKITLSTIHSVKGLEFDAVIIMDCVDEVFPSTSKNYEGSEEDNEELRCFYVAATRARKELHLMCPSYVMKYNTPLYGHLSHYISKNSSNFHPVYHDNY